MNYAEAKNFKTKQDIELIISIIITVITVLIPLLATIFIYYPMFKDAQYIMNQQKALRHEIELLQNKYEVIKSEDPQKILEVDAKLERLLPSEMTLSELGIFINTEAETNNLFIDRLMLNENTTTNSNFIIQSKNKDLNIQKIQGPVKVRGGKDNIFNFLDFLGSGQYAVEFDRVSLVKSGDTNEWTASFMVIHYYMPKAKSVPVDEPLIKIDWQLLNSTGIGQK